VFEVRRHSSRGKNPGHRKSKKGERRRGWEKKSLSGKKERSKPGGGESDLFSRLRARKEKVYAPGFRKEDDGNRGKDCAGR